MVASATGGNTPAPASLISGCGTTHATGGAPQKGVRKKNGGGRQRPLRRGRNGQTPSLSTAHERVSNRRASTSATVSRGGRHEHNKKQRARTPAEDGTNTEERDASPARTEDSRKPCTPTLPDQQPGERTREARRSKSRARREHSRPRTLAVKLCLGLPENCTGHGAFRELHGAWCPPRDCVGRPSCKRETLTIPLRRAPPLGPASSRGEAPLPFTRCTRRHSFRTLPPPPPSGASIQVVCRGSPPHPFVSCPTACDWIAGCVLGVACSRARHDHERGSGWLGRVPARRGTDVETGS